MTQTSSQTITYEPVPTRAPRDWWQAVKRGFSSRCPHCGEGKLYRAYLKPVEDCAVCGEEIHHQRADDAPPYATIFIVGHVVGPALLLSQKYEWNLPAWADALLWCTIALIMSLWLLPRVKGALINYQWALYMHGFETARTPPGRIQ